ncbi:MAG TPA: tripartite tricarboxylate transporter substrate binding protein [Ramlibacter sp.]|nr:tripartite tricarboxylate transporter substrate binding protein [Ramlibacter sp.]
MIKHLVPALSLVFTCALAPQAQAQDYPARPIRLMTPFAPGGGTDILARVIAKSMSETLGQQVFVENKPGGNTTIATEALVRSAPDGYTLLLQTNNLAANVAMYAGKLRFDTLKDIAPVAGLGSISHVLVVNASVKANNLQEYVALARANPGKITFASAGSGTVNHLAGEMLKVMAKVNLVHVPYTSAGAAMPNLLGGQTDSMFAAAPYSVTFVNSGKLRALAVTTKERSKSLPNVPTMAEQGYPGYDLSSWFGIVAPAGTPRPIVAKLNAAILKALKDPAVQESLADYELRGSSPEEFAEFLRGEVAKSAEIIRISGAKID